MMRISASFRGVQYLLLAVLLSPAANRLWAQKKIPTLCSKCIDERDGRIYIMTPDSCPDYASGYNKAYDFILTKINDKFRPFSFTTRANNNVFPGPPIAQQKYIDSFHLVEAGSGNKVYQIYLTEEPGLREYSGYPVSLPYGLAYNFQLHRVPKNKADAVIKNIVSMQKIGLFDKQVNTDLKPVPYRVFTDQRAKYLQSYDVSDPLIFNGINMDMEDSDEEADKFSMKEKLIKLWVQCYISVDSNWNSVDMPERMITPIALQTDKSLYVFSQTVVPASVKGGGSIDQFQGKIFDLSSASDYERLYNRVLQTFKEDLNATFQSLPLSTQPVSGLAPNQIRFQRKFDKSEVLKGFTGPYYELSTYTMIVWNGPDESHLGNNRIYLETDYLKKNYQNNQVFLSESTSLQIAVGKTGPYPEPKPEQYSAYEKAVRAAILEAVKKTTSRLGGQFINNIGKIK
jgi:hypothetical protein